MPDKFTPVVHMNWKPGTVEDVAEQILRIAEGRFRYGRHAHMTFEQLKEAAEAGDETALAAVRGSLGAAFIVLSSTLTRVASALPSDEDIAQMVAELYAMDGQKKN